MEKRKITQDDIVGNPIHGWSFVYFTNTNTYNFVNKNDEFINPETDFEYAEEFYEDSALVKLNGKYNFIKPDGTYVCKQWLDEINTWFTNKLKCEVCVDDKIYFLRWSDGKLLTPKIKDRKHSHQYNCLRNFKERVQILENQLKYLKNIKTNYWNLNQLPDNQGLYISHIDRISNHIKSTKISLQNIRESILETKRTIKNYQRTGQIKEYNNE